MAQRLDPLTYLERSDKWYLGGGRSSCFAPPFPRFLDTPGFWDEAHFAEVPLLRLFTYFVVDNTGQPLKLRSTGPSWRPDRLRQTFECDARPELVIREEKVLLEEDVFASHLTVANRGEEACELDVVVWTVRHKQAEPGPTPALETVELADDKARYTETFTTAEGETGRLHFCLGASQDLISSSINLCEGSCLDPLWAVSTLPEKFRNGKLQGDFKVEVGATSEGEVHLALHYRLQIPSHERRDITIACAVAAHEACSCARHDRSLQADVVASAVSQWREYFESMPYFSCSDPFLTRYYWYRWYGLRLCMVNAELGHLPYPCVFEGIGGFRHHISYSAQCHMLECSWLRDPAVAQGSLLGMIAGQFDNGAFPGHIGLFGRANSFYHANWGAHARQVLALHPDEKFAEDIYEPLCRYARYFDIERDREQSGLYDVINQGETGQEYMARYQVVDPEADQWGPLQLKGVDATVYLYELKRALALLARRLGHDDQATQWEQEADKIGQAICEKMWDPGQRNFFDCDPQTLEPTGCAAAVCFYPFLTDLAKTEHVVALRRHLLNPAEFWLPCGPPSTSAADPTYSAQAEWKGKRQSCPWNGRMWPMTSSHVCEALARAARTLDDHLRPQAAELIRRFIQTMFYNADSQRPNCFEHYNPVTGEPCAYRGVDDYQHSWVVDLIIKHVAGLQVREDNLLVVDPLDFDLREFELRGVSYKGHTVDILYGPHDPDQAPLLQVLVDGEVAGSRTGLGAIEVELPELA